MKKSEIWKRREERRPLHGEDETRWPPSNIDLTGPRKEKSGKSEEDELEQPVKVNR